MRQCLRPRLPGGGHANRPPSDRVAPDDPARKRANSRNSHLHALTGAKPRPLGAPTGPRGAQPLGATGLEAVTLDLGQQRVGDQHLAGLGRRRHARGDVDVNAEIVAAQPAGPAPVNARPHARRVVVDLDPAHRLLRIERRLDRRLGGQERGHQTIAQALDDPALVLGDHRLDLGSDLAQEFEHGGVAGLQRPPGEPDQIGEQQRHLEVAAAAAGRLRNRLPDLKGGQANLLGNALASRLQRGDAAGDHLDGGSTRGRQGIAELLVPRQPPADAAGSRQERRLAVQSRDGGTQPREPVGRLLGLIRGVLDFLAAPVLVR